jgi:hypothetical protein
LAKAVEAREALVRKVNPDSPDRVKCLNNLGLALLAGPAHDRHPQVRDRVSEVFREACGTGLDSNPGAVLKAAGSWGGWAAARSFWSEAATAYEFGMTAMEKLFRVQPLRRHKEVWLTNCGQLAAEAGYACVRAGLLSESLERDRADLRHLQVLGCGELRDRYLLATIMVSRSPT